ncbi:MAG: hypothetical protein ABIU54_09855 [Candidatus Eisenbacteria bacterium]
MRSRIAIVLLLVLVAIGVHAGEPAPAPVLTRYRLGLLYRGPGYTPDRTARADSLQAGHRANIKRMFERGALQAAGPFGDDTALRGIFVFTGDADMKLDSLLAGDPLLAEQRLRLEMYGWMAPVGISEDYRRRLAYAEQRGETLKDSLVVFTMVLLHRGPSWTSNLPPSVARTLKAQRAYAERLRSDGRLVLESAIEGTGELRGLYLFRTDTTETRRLIQADPAVRAGRFRPEIHPWWTAYGAIPGH